MNRNDFRTILEQLDLSSREQEIEARSKMIQLLDENSECFHRFSFPAHFTGSALIVSADGQKALLHHHRKLNRWLQFGGHCDGDEHILRVAQREALEESGIEGLIITSQRPFDLDIHEIPATEKEPTHWHYDVRYVLIAPENARFKISEESHALKWFSPDEMAQLPLDEGMLRMLKKWKQLLQRRAAHSG